MKSLIMSLNLVESLGATATMVLVVALIALDATLILLGLWLIGVDVTPFSLWSWLGASVLIMVFE